MKNNIVKILLGGMMISLSLLLTLEMSLRSLFGISLTWSYEIARTLMIWIVYLGSVQLAWENNAIKITLLKDKFPILDKINYFIMLITYSTISIISINFIMVVIPYSRTSSTTGFPTWINYLIIPLAFFTILLRKFRRVMEEVC